MTGFALETRNLVKRYGRRRVLDGFTLAVPRGAVLGLVGANGAGKTTWMMTVAGLLRPASGTIDILGGGPFDAAVHAGRLALLPQDSELPLEATPMGLFYRFGRLQGLSAETARRSASEVLKAVNLADRAKSSIRSLSHGMRTRVRVAQCFLGNPELVLLDEPLNGLDPLEADRLRRFLRSRAGNQTRIIYMMWSSSARTWRLLRTGALFAWIRWWRSRADDRLSRCFWNRRASGREPTRRLRRSVSWRS